MKFSDYITTKQDLILSARPGITAQNKDQLLAANAPFELAPSTPTHKACLLIHGLYDSPFTMKDIATLFANNNYLTRAILLPGHGTAPKDLNKVSYKDWQVEVAQAINSFGQEITEITLVGFSTGAALAIDYILSSQDQRIKRMIACSPAIALAPPGHQLLPLISTLGKVIKPLLWLRQHNVTDYARYMSHSTHGANEVYQLTKQLRKYDASKLPDTLVAYADTDNVVSPQATQQFFKDPKHQLICYSSTKQGTHQNITYRNSCFPTQGILDFSHLSVLVSPDNPHYGSQPDYAQAIEKLGKKEKPLMQGEASLKNLKKYHIKRLTYNPDFDYLAEKIIGFITSTS